MEKIIYDFYYDLFDSHVHLPSHHLREDGHIIPEVLPSKIRHAIISEGNSTAPDPDRIRPEHLKNRSRLITFTLFRNSSRHREGTRCRCLTFIDLKKVFDSVETEVVMETLDNQGVPTQYIKVLRELYSNFTAGISPLYRNIIIDVKRGSDRVIQSHPKY
ncbi:hypothetical protein RB195_005375 [Necator americanus]|uniref:Reverse transcriptase domain-containing protein n=1 Tax=Necator americanus TaxID=51031 RepID=A0ABR1BMH8_NECAM